MKFFSDLVCLHNTLLLYLFISKSFLYDSALALVGKIL